jgi:hypothetical protein
MTVVGILGTLHSDDMRKDFNYPLEKMREVIEFFKPDIICGEVRPEDWQKYYEDRNYEGYLGPSEYRKLIVPLCEEKGIKFVPIDWFEDDLIHLDYFQGKSTSEIDEIEKEFNSIMDVYMETGQSSALPFNSLDFNNIVEKKQAFQEMINPLVHNICWTCRNQIMVERIKQTIVDNKDKRILCTIGTEHAYFYCKSLATTDIKVIYPIG